MKYRRRRQVALAATAVLVAALVIAALAWFSPLMSARTVTVDGIEAISRSDILTALAVPSGTPLLRVDTDAAAARIAAIPRVARSRVRVDFPSTIHVTIVERTAVLFFETAKGALLMDSTGVEFAVAPPLPGVPRLKTAHPGDTDPGTHAALTVLAAVAKPLRAQVETISVRSVSDITLSLRDGRVVEWGSKADSERKAAITPALLTRPGHTYDVSSPDLPTVK